MSEQDIIGALTVGLVEIAGPETVIGQPIAAGAVTLIPVIKVAGAMAAGRAVGGGAAGGFRVAPVAMVVVRGTDVEVLPVGERNPATERLMEQLPELLAQLAGCSRGAQAEGPQTGEGQDPGTHRDGRTQSNTDSEPSTQVPGR